MYDEGGIKYFVWKMQILLVCQYYYVYSKKKVYEKPKKKQELNWNTDARNRTWAVHVSQLS